MRKYILNSKLILLLVAVVAAMPYTSCRTTRELSQAQEGVYREGDRLGVLEGGITFDFRVPRSAQVASTGMRRHTATITFIDDPAPVHIDAVARNYHLESQEFKERTALESFEYIISRMDPLAIVVLLDRLPSVSGSETILCEVQSEGEKLFYISCRSKEFVVSIISFNRDHVERLYTHMRIRGIADL